LLTSQSHPSTAQNPSTTTLHTATVFKMSVVSLLGVEVKNNPAQFDAPYEFEITFECLEQLQKGMSVAFQMHMPH
jgi:hypothetical protein